MICVCVLSSRAFVCCKRVSSFITDATDEKQTIRLFVCCACAFFSYGRATNTQTHSRARCFLLPLRPTHTTVHRQLERPHSAAPIQKQPKINIWPHAAPSPRPTIRHHSLGPQPLYHPTSHPGGLRRSMHSAIRTDGNFRLGTLARMAGRMPSTDRSFEPIAIGFCLWRTT